MGNWVSGSTKKVPGSAHRPPQNTSRGRLSVGSVAPQSQGSFGKIVSHLQSLREVDVITDDEYDELRSCLADVVKEAEGLAVEVRLRGRMKSKESSARVLGAFGVATMGPTKSINPARRCTRDASSATIALLHDEAFNCCDRESVSDDIRLLMSAFTSQDLTNGFAVKTDALSMWLRAIAAQYPLANPYHNWRHALDVFQYSYLTLVCGGAEAFLSSQDIFVVLLGAISHDTGHTGTSNPFLVNCRSNLAIVYNDKSPLENMHASIFFQTLLKPGMNFLAALDSESFNKVRAKVIDVILATDMIHHFVLVDKMAELASKEELDTEDLRRQSSGSTGSGTCATRDEEESRILCQEDRRTLIKAFVHMADISNGCRPWNVNKLLVASLEEELYSQGDHLRDLGMPILPMMDRHKDSLAVAQDFFLNKLVTPLLLNFRPLVSHRLMMYFETQLQDNAQRWADLVSCHGKKCVEELLALEAERQYEEDPDQSDSEEDEEEEEEIFR